VTRRGGLGKGLGALIPTAPVAPLAERPGVVVAGEAAVAEPAPAEVPGASYREVPVDEIRPNAKQPRQAFDEDAHEELKTSIKEFGLLQPVVVRETGPGSYELVMGERRWRAGRDLGLPTIPAIIRDTADDAMLRDALLENIHRVQLNPLATALMKVQQGGAIAVWASSGLTEPPSQSIMNERFYMELFRLDREGNGPRLGDATLRAKSVISDPDVRRTWILFGDPSMRLR